MLFQCSVGTDFASVEYFDNTNVTNKASGLAICCNSASASSRSVHLFGSTEEATVSFYVKTCSGCHGVIFSYKKGKAFSLDYNSTVIINYGRDMVWNSGISLDDNVWYQLVITFSRPLKELTLYAFNELTGNVPKIYSVFNFNETPFRNGGSLSLGKFQISQAVPRWKKVDSFVGCFDMLGFASR